jgi:hypothetical protein
LIMWALARASVLSVFWTILWEHVHPPADAAMLVFCGYLV